MVVSSIQWFQRYFVFRSALEGKNEKLGKKKKKDTARPWVLEKYLSQRLKTLSSSIFSFNKSSTEFSSFANCTEDIPASFNACCMLFNGSSPMEGSAGSV